MINSTLTSQPQTLADYNGMVRLASEIMSSKEYRRKRRKKVVLKFGSVRINTYL